MKPGKLYTWRRRQDEVFFRYAQGKVQNEYKADSTHVSLEHGDIVMLVERFEMSSANAVRPLAHRTFRGWIVLKGQEMCFVPGDGRFFGKSLVKCAEQ